LHHGRLIASIFIGVAIFACDQTLKSAAMATQYEYRCITQDFICFGLARNERSAFGVFTADSSWFVFLIPLLLATIDGFILRFLARPYSYDVVVLFSVGALSNWLDRLRFGYVVDYFGIGLPTVNFADYCIVLAVARLFFAITLKDGVR
jgi:lipoprotein signal peptidase